jgi:hypothetical protein
MSTSQLPLLPSALVSPPMRKLHRIIISERVLALLPNIKWVFNFTADMAGTMIKLTFQESKLQTPLS